MHIRLIMVLEFFVLGSTLTRYLHSGENFLSVVKERNVRLLKLEQAVEEAKLILLSKDPFSETSLAINHGNEDRRCLLIKL